MHVRVPVMAVVLVAAALSGVRAQTVDATSVLAAAREALGGEKRLTAVKTLVATGRTRRVQGDNLVPIEFEILMERGVRQQFEQARVIVGQGVRLRFDRPACPSRVRRAAPRNDLRRNAHSEGRPVAALPGSPELQADAVSAAGAGV